MFIIIEGTFTKVVRLILVNYRKNLTSQLIKNWRRFLTSGLNVMLWRRGGLMVSYLFLSLLCLILYWCCEEKYSLGHTWELEGSIVSLL